LIPLKCILFVGSWIEKNSRDKIILATKAAGGARGMEWVRGGNHAFNRTNLRGALEGSLKRLKTDYIDLYQLHWPERNTPMFGNYLFDPEQEREYTAFAETLEALSELIKEGKIRNIGLSNEWPWGLMQFLNASERDSLPRVVSMQNAYNLINRTYDSSLREMGYRENVPLLAYSPMAFGHLSAKYIRLIFLMILHSAMKSQRLFQLLVLMRILRKTYKFHLPLWHWRLLIRVGSVPVLLLAPPLWIN